MGKTKWDQFSKQEMIDAYQKAGNLEGMAKALGITYPTACQWARQFGISIKRPGYTQPFNPITGRQCRHAREYLKLTRDTFCAEAGISKQTLMVFELNKKTMRKSSVDKVMAQFARYHIVFHDDGTFEQKSIENDVGEGALCLTSKQ